MKTQILLTLVLSLVTITSRAVTIAQWTFETSVQTPAFVDSNATGSDFTLSSGTISFHAGNAPTSATGISGTGWNESEGNKWWSFTVTANAGYVINSSSLTFDDRASGTGPSNWSVTLNGVPVVSNESTHTSFTGNTVDLSAASFQGLNSAVIRIFGYGASGGSGTWRLDNVSFEGAVMRSESVPEGSVGWAGLGALLFLMAMSRRCGLAAQV